MLLYYKESFLKLLEDLHKKFNKFEGLKESDFSYLFESFLSFLQMPHPPKHLYKYFINPKILSLILRNIIEDYRLSYNDRNELKKYYELLFSLLRRKTDEHFLQFRTLGPQGYYPNIELKKNGCHFLIQNMLPVLITKNKHSAEDVFLNSSEIGWITRNELKIATAVSLTLEGGLVHFYFTDFNNFRIDCDVIEQIPIRYRLEFLSELMSLSNRFISLNTSYDQRMMAPGVSSYSYTSLKGCEPHFYKVFDAFSIRDHLLLRTSTHLLKSIMLWHNQSFGEEAVANTFFCIEGCLHLLQKKYGENSSKLNLKLIQKIFKDNFPHGEESFEALNESYQTRVQLVHPETDWGTEWNPFIMADDFYDNYSFCRFLLNFILIDRIVDEI